MAKSKNNKYHQSHDGFMSHVILMRKGQSRAFLLPDKFPGCQLCTTLAKSVQVFAVGQFVFGLFHLLNF
jgi:hypothetical protein